MIKKGEILIIIFFLKYGFVSSVNSMMRDYVWLCELVYPILALIYRNVYYASRFS